MKNNIFLVLVLFSLIGFAQEPNDCVNSITVCGNSNFSSNAQGIGNIQEVSGCGGFEHNSIWLKINIVQSGTLGFDLIPNDPDILVDYDFWVYGPNRVCNNLGSPIRCSTTNPNAAGLVNNHTGINGGTTLTQTGPGANGNGYVYWLSVIAGQSYYIAIDRPEGDGGFEIQWTGTATENGGAFPSPPDVMPVDDLKACSSSPNIAIFDLNAVRTTINSDPNNSVDFFASLADATDGNNPLPNIYANVINPQQIFAKVTSNGTDCYSLIDFNLIVTPVPDASISASTTASCNSEDVTFTFTGTPDTTVNYSINGGAIQQIILDASGNATLTQTLTVDTTLALLQAQILNGSDQVVCSQTLNTDVTVTVNTISAPVVVNNSPICEGETGELDFVGEPNGIISYTINGGATQTFNLDASGVYTLALPNLVVDTAVDIISITSASVPFCDLQVDDLQYIVVNPLPVVISPSTLFECNNGANLNTAPFDLDAQSAAISNSDPNVMVTYYETQALAQLGNPNDALVSPYDSTSANQTIYVRLETSEGCVAYTTLSLQVIDVPTANVVAPLEVCDVTNQGIGIFDLTQASNDIITGNTQAVQVTFYLLQQEALNNTNAITNDTSFQNTTPYNQTIYVRVSSTTTACFSVIGLDLQVFDTPVIGSLQPYQLCDDNQDGYTIFDLTTLNATILGSQAATDYTISFYESETDANQSVGAIANPQNYQNIIVGVQMVWVRLENNASSCFDVTAFEISVDTPLVLEASYTASACDSDGDGQYTFNLLDYTAFILANATNPSDYEVVFYPSIQDAINNTNSIQTPDAYTGQSSPVTTLGIRVTNTQSFCWNTAEMPIEITILPDPDTIVLTPLQTCGLATPNDTAEPFDLTQVETIISNGVSNLSFSYHTSQNDADTGNNQITNPNNYLTSASANIFIRVTSFATNNPNCYVVFPLELIVNALPIMEWNSLSGCSTDGTGFYSFDLQAQIPNILGDTQNLNDFTVTFYQDEATINQITTNPYTNTTPHAQTIYVVITNNASNCSSTLPFDLMVEAGALATMPSPVAVCDYDGVNDGFNTFDLSSLNAEILNGQDFNNFSVSYFLTNQEAIDGVNPIDNPESFQNTTPYNQTIYVRVINNNSPTACVATTSFDFTVNPVLKPEVEAVAGLNTLCVDYETNELQNEVTLISTLQNANYTYTWYLNGTELIGANQGTYTIDTVAPGHYTVAVTEIQSSTNCTSTMSEPFEVIQSGQAVFVEVVQSNAFTSPQTITVLVEGYGDYWFQLDNGSILDNGGIFVGVETGLHTVSVYDMKTQTPSCDAISIDNIRVIDYPKFLTPNNDGYNDSWNVFALNNQPNAKITIYDRFGKILSSIKPSGPGWDGTFNGNILPSTDYWFVLTYEEFGQLKTFKSHFALKR